ncbi:MAG: DNA-methyltransferase [Candidatus Hodarchaeales archaeon]|jgi:site-specific DNA-methyltransferase (adenine-specific)
MTMATKHHLFIGDCTKAGLQKLTLTLPKIDLLVTSPPYFNAPFDYKDLFQNYDTFLKLIANFSRFFLKKLKTGAIFALNIDDMLVKGVKYPIIADSIRILCQIGYQLRGRIVWKKPEGYIRISRRSGVFIQNPFPMYFYPDNLLETILIFQKLPVREQKERKKIILEDIWEMTNVLPLKGRLEVNIAAFPDDLPRILIENFTNKNAWICDPFLGSGTTMKVARELDRNSIGVEKLSTLLPIIRKKSGFTKENLQNYFDSDQLIIETHEENEVSNEEININQEKKLSLLHQSLDQDFSFTDDFKFHLLIIDFRDKSNSILNAEFAHVLSQLYPGRILAVYFDPLHKKTNDFFLNQLMDFIMQCRLRFRDKITIQHVFEDQWEVNTNFNSKVVFRHCYYEVLLFQKGTFDYRSITKEKKQECIINKKQFQREKWYLSIWNFGKLLRIDCDSIVTSRLVELFLYNEELVGSNISPIINPKRKFNCEKIGFR